MAVERCRRAAAGASTDESRAMSTLLSTEVLSASIGDDLAPNQAAKGGCHRSAASAGGRWFAGQAGQQHRVWPESLPCCTQSRCTMTIKSLVCLFASVFNRVGVVGDRVQGIDLDQWLAVLRAWSAAPTCFGLHLLQKKAVTE